MSETGGTDDAATPEPAAARRAYMPSSIGLSVSGPGRRAAVEVTVRWATTACTQRRGRAGQSASSGAGRHAAITGDRALGRLPPACSRRGPGRAGRMEADAARGAYLAGPARTNDVVRGEGRAQQRGPESGARWCGRSRAMVPREGCRKGHARSPSSSSTAAIPAPMKPATRRSPSRPSWRSPARSRWCPGRTCGAFRARTGTIGWPTFSTATCSSTPWGTA